MLDLNPNYINPGNVTDCTLEYFSTYDNQQILNSNCLYILKGSTAAKQPFMDSALSFIIYGNSDNIYHNCNAQILIIPAEVSIDALFNRLAELFFKYQNWINTLKLYTAQKKNLEAFGRISLPFFREPLSLFKFNFFTLFSVYDKKYGQLPEEYYNYITSYIYEESNVGSKITMDDVLKNALNKKEPYIFQSSESTGPLTAP